MCAGYPDQLATIRNFAKRISAANHRYAALAGTRKLRMILRHRRCHDERTNTSNVRGIVRSNGDPQSAEVGGV